MAEIRPAMRAFVCTAAFAFSSLMAAPDAPPLTSLGDFYKLLPADIQLDQKAPALPLAIEIANRIFADQAFARDAQMSLSFNRFESQPRSPYGDAVVGTTLWESSPNGGSLIKIEFRVYFSPDCRAALATHPAATSLAFHGTVAKAVMKEAKQTTFSVDIVAARLGEQDRPSARIDRAPKVEVISAVYGGGKHQADVTERVRRYVTSKKPFWTNPGDLGADPTPGWNKTLTVVFNKNGIRRLQARTETEYVLPESYYMPQDKEELAAWLVGTRWKADREFVFLPGGLFLTQGEAAQWKALESSKFLITWKTGMQIECNFHYDWTYFKEKEGKGLTFARVP